MSRAIPVILAMALAVAAPVPHLHPVSVAAQERQPPVPTIYQGPVGPYRIVIQGIPSPPTQGLFNLNATVQDPNTGEFVDDASVRVFAQRQESAERGRASLRNSPARPTSYSTQLNLLEEGAWTFTFQVSGALGDGSTEVLLEVGKQPRSVAGWLAWGGMAFALLLVLGLAWRNANRIRQSRGR